MNKKRVLFILYPLVVVGTLLLHLQVYHLLFDSILINKMILPAIACFGIAVFLIDVFRENAKISHLSLSLGLAILIVSIIPAIDNNNSNVFFMVDRVVWVLFITGIVMIILNIPLYLYINLERDHYEELQIEFNRKVRIIFDVIFTVLFFIYLFIGFIIIMSNYAP